MGATVLARLAGIDTAVDTFGIDRRTVRGWVKGEPPPDDQWTAVRDVLLARGAELAAKGETKGLVQTLTAAGISERNVRYGQLIARREARREQADAPAEANPVRAAIDALDDSRRRLMRDILDAELGARVPVTRPTSLLSPRLPAATRATAGFWPGSPSWQRCPMPRSPRSKLG